MASALPGLIVRAESPGSPVAATMIEALCAELTRRYHRPPSPFTMEEAAGVRSALVVAWLDGRPVGCGALR